MVLQDDTPTELVRARIQLALEKAGVAGVVPTPLDAVAQVAGISEVLDIGEFNEVQRAAHRRRRTPGEVLKRFVGAVFFEPQVVLVDRTKPEEMRRWTEAHELTHRLLPWHVKNSYVDPNETLSPGATEQQEREANVGGAKILFQGDPFWERSSDYRPGLEVPLLLAREFATSITATIRYYVESHPATCAVVCASRGIQRGQSRITYGVESAAFRSQFGAATNLFPTGQIPASTVADTSALASAVRQARADREIGHASMTATDVNGDLVQLDVQTFFNGYNTFVFVQPHRRVRLGRRLAVAAVAEPRT